MAARLLLSDGSKFLLVDGNAHLLLSRDPSDGATNATSAETITGTSSTLVVAPTNVTSTLSASTAASSTTAVSDG